LLKIDVARPIFQDESLGKFDHNLYPLYHVISIM